MRRYIIILFLLFFGFGVLLSGCAAKKQKPQTRPVDTKTEKKDAATRTEKGKKLPKPEKKAEKIRVKQQPPSTPKEIKMPVDRTPFDMRPIYFEYDSDLLDAEAKKRLFESAEWFLDHPDNKVTISGHTDERGTSDYNLALGDRRALTVKAFLIHLGVKEAQINTISHGEERRIAFGVTEDARAKNRRVEFKLSK